ncbi:unnamed protein product [Onchocerca flexuosa]|uniref:Tyrosine-protein kinase n=1 Tax=Onchocerca flexuosa TaxID=387005 RepID=A0A183H8L4_9BILA|nr:unnamed protein product [Onchocerca flexuosa]
MYKEPGLEYAEWYHGLLSRKDINKLLTKHGQFLQGLQPVLSVKWNDMIMHFTICQNDGKVSIEKCEFASICELISRNLAKTSSNFVCNYRYHMITKDPITDQSGAMLLYVVPRQNWEVKHEQVKILNEFTYPSHKNSLYPIELGELLGEGALSAVYKGILKNNEREKEVAIKVRKGRRLDREIVEQICREARIMRKLEHPNLVRLYGIAISKVLNSCLINQI